jgi:3D (Asp-Asp-Asp) domain-containing protein
MQKLLKIFLISIAVIGILGNLQIPDQKTKESIRPEEYISGLLILENNSLLPSSPLPEPKVTKRIRVVVTAYSSTPEETDSDPFITAAGTKVRDGIIANNLLPFGTKVRLPELYGEKIFTVEDRMNSKKGYYHIDIWFPSYWEAKGFGAKNTYLEILES